MRSVIIKPSDSNRNINSRGVLIEKLVPGGLGLGHLDGHVVFVPLTTPGDRVTLREVHKRKGVYFAEPESIVESAPDRREPACPWFGRCGGCQWMHIDYGPQIHWKGEIVKQVLRGVANIREWPALRVHPSPSEYHYRFRTRLQIRGSKVGFYRRASNVIVPWDRCLQLPATLNSAVHDIRTWLDSRGGFPGLVSCEVALSPVDQSLTFDWNFSKRGKNRASTGKVMDGIEQLISGKQVEIAGQTAHDSEGKTMAARGGNLTLRSGSVHLTASPGTFFQVNPGVNDLLVQRVLDHIGSHGSTSLLDLYCGNGNFSLPASAAGLKTLGVESNNTAVLDARSSSGPHSRFVRMEAVNFLSRFKEDPDAVIVDPPRMGLPREMIHQLGIRRFPLLLYVSCEPSTLARDLARLTQAGYVIKNLELFDMFPQTFHAEMLAVMKR